MNVCVSYSSSFFVIFLLFHKIKGNLYFSDISDYKIKQMDHFSLIFLKY